MQIKRKKGKKIEWGKEEQNRILANGWKWNIENLKKKKKKKNYEMVRKIEQDQDESEEEIE